MKSGIRIDDLILYSWDKKEKDLQFFPLYRLLGDIF